MEGASAASRPAIPAGRLARAARGRGAGRHKDSHYSSCLVGLPLASIPTSHKLQLARSSPPTARSQTRPSPRSPPRSSPAVPTPYLPAGAHQARAEMDGAADAALSAWATVRGFFTPATLFLVVNLVIGTIWLTSRSHQRRRRSNGYTTAHEPPFHNQHDHQEPPFHHQQEHQYYDDHQQHHEQQQYVPPPPAPAPLARTSSVLDRLRSIGLYRFRSGDFPPEYTTDSRDVAFSPAPVGGDAHYERSRSNPAPAKEERSRPAPSRMRKSSSSSEARKAEVPRVPAARVVRRAVALEEDDVVEHARADEFTGNSFAQQKPSPSPSPPAQHEEEEEEEEQYYREEYVPPLRPAPLARAPSVLERLRSFGLYRFRSGDIAADDAASAVAEHERNQAQKLQGTQYSRSRSEPSKEQSKKKKQQQQSSDAKMSKSSSEARKPPAPVEAEPAAEEGGVDARADDFINSFRKQLQLQRLNSLLNYKDMLNRGA
uniref:Uncharacterized protein n=1 Tax=Avena sativa TaxID=4498 RepID=A0ACD5T7X9_AVESA